MSLRLNAFSDPRSVLGGVPQGSLLGVFLFNCSIDSFEPKSDDVERYNGETGTPMVVQDTGTDHPVPDEPKERDYRHLPLFLRLPLELYKYVDDNVILEKLNMDMVPTDGRFVRSEWAVRTENQFMKIVHQAVAQGMKVNAAKTKALLITELKGYASKAYFTDNEGGQVLAGETMRILGVVFSSDPGMTAQVADIRKKFVARIWALRHLGRMGMQQADLVKVYKSSILPMHDYCSTVYNSSLTITQSGQLERLQAMALKAIYCYDVSHRALLSLSGIASMRVRRDLRGDKFAARCLSNPRFASWFPRHAPARPTRHPMEYEERRARTKMLFNSPFLPPQTAT